MASIPLVDLSERSRRGIGSDPRLISVAARQNGPGDTGELVGECDRKHVAVEPFRCPHDPWPQSVPCGVWPSYEHDMGGLHEKRSQVFVAAFRDLPEDRAIACRFLSGYEPHQAPQSRPCLKPAPLPMAATTALEMIGPIPGTVIRRWQPSSCSASASMSADTPAMRSSNRRQSPVKSAMRATIRGESGPEVALRISGNALRKGINP